jgi:hypothetical protein
MTGHGKQTAPPTYAELIEIIETLLQYLRVDGVHEADGEREVRDAARESLRRYRAAAAEIDSQARREIP